jgi:hypothetical protein
MLHFLAKDVTLVHLPDFKLIEGRRGLEEAHSIAERSQYLSRKLEPDIAKFTLPDGIDGMTPQFLVREDGTLWAINFVPGIGWHLNPPDRLEDDKDIAILKAAVEEVKSKS